VSSKSVREPLEYLRDINKISVFNYNARATVVKSYIAFIILVLLLTFILLEYFKEYVAWMKPLLIAVLLVPTVLLILPVTAPWDTIRFAASLISTVTIFSLSVFYLFKDNLKIFVSTCLLSAGLILADTFLDNPLMRLSILGYDPIIGARFYGIGNEYMGFFAWDNHCGTTALIDCYRDKAGLLKN